MPSICWEKNARTPRVARYSGFFSDAEAGDFRYQLSGTNFVESYAQLKGPRAWGLPKKYPFVCLRPSKCQENGEIYTFGDVNNF